MDLNILEETELRANIVEWYDIDQNAEVLEINAICPPITKCLQKKSRKVRTLKNIYMLDEENETENQYDVIAVFNEVALLRDPLDDTQWASKFVRLIREHMAENGKLIIACNNRFGL